MRSTGQGEPRFQAMLGVSPRPWPQGQDDQCPQFQVIAARPCVLLNELKVPTGTSLSPFPVAYSPH